MNLDTKLFVSGSKAGRRVDSGEGRGGTNKGQVDSKNRSEDRSSQAKITCNHCQKPGHIRVNRPKCQSFKCQGWGSEAVFCSSKVPTPIEDEDKEKKDESSVMVVDQEPDSEVTVETKLDEVDSGGHDVLHDR